MNARRPSGAAARFRCVVAWLLGAPRVFWAPEGSAAVCAGGRRCVWPHGCSGRRRARPPARLGDLTSFGAAPRSPPVPSGPSGALHTSGAWCAGVWLDAPARCPARPRHRPRNFARNSLATLSNIEFRSLELQRFWVLLKVHAIELRARFWEGCPCSPSNFACNSLDCVSWFEV